MQLYCYPSKYFLGGISRVIDIEPLDLAIEASLGEKGGVGKSFSNKVNCSSDPKSSKCKTEWIQDSHILV